MAVQGGSTGIRAVEQAAAVLQAFSAEGVEHGVRDLARELGISKSTVQRILVSLTRTRLLEFRSDTQKYSIGPGLVRIAPPFLVKGSLIEVARPVIGELRDATGETLLLSVAVDGARLTIHQLPSKSPLRFITEVGTPYPLISGATGRVLLAFMPVGAQEDALARLFAGKYMVTTATGHTFTKRELRANLSEVYNAGYAYSSEEWVHGGGAVSVPIIAGGELLAALSILAPIIRFGESIIDRDLRLLLSGARRIEEGLAAASISGSCMSTMSTHDSSTEAET